MHCSVVGSDPSFVLCLLQSTTLLLPSHVSDPAAMVAQAMAVFNRAAAATAVAPIGNNKRVRKEAAVEDSRRKETKEEAFYPQIDDSSSDDLGSTPFGSSKRNQHHNKRGDHPSFSLQSPLE